LTATELQVYAAEHHHAAAALAGASRRAAGLTGGLLAEELTRHADDQEDYLELWWQFAVETGWCRSAWHFGEDPLPETVACARAWSGASRPLDQHLVTVYAIESLFARMTRLQLTPLIDRYGFDARSLGYFELRSERASGEAALMQAALTSRLPVPSPRHLLNQAELTYRSYWELLDGVRTFSRRSS
jgi:pyrroloquinoline quinone (PQQ) biosynthesis protein C